MRSLIYGGVAAAAFLAGPHLASADDTWSDVAPGVRHLHRVTANQNIHALVVDLCTPGVGLRATGEDERGQRVSAWGASVGALAAVNGDFFSLDGNFWTDGPSVHAGAKWGGEDHEYVGLLGIGEHRVELRSHELTTGVEPWMTEVVSGHPTIVKDGVDLDGSGDPLCANRHPRTSVGLSADRRYLQIAVVDGRASTRIGMTCLELSALMRELGAANAVNQDGGGSSTMWIAGAGVLNHPTDGSERTVGNHLGLFASGTGDAGLCPSRIPRGYLDAVSCEAIAGWAQDEDAPDESIDVHVYVDGPAGDPAARAWPVRADVARDDLCTAIGSCNHGYVAAVPPELRDSKPHAVMTYAIDREAIANPLLAGGPKTLWCPAPELGVKRHVVSPEIFDAWHMDWNQIAPIDDATLASFPVGDVLDEPLHLVRGPGRPNVYAIMGGVRRWVQSGESMAAWRFPWEAIEDLPNDALLEVWPEGPPLPLVPFVTRGTGPEVYLFDAPMTGVPGLPDEEGHADDPRTPGAPDDAAVDEGGGCAVARGRGERVSGGALLAGVLAFWLARRRHWRMS